MQPSGVALGRISRFDPESEGTAQSRAPIEFRFGVGTKRFVRARSKVRPIDKRGAALSGLVYSDLFTQDSRRWAALLSPLGPGSSGCGESFDGTLELRCALYPIKPNVAILWSITIHAKTTLARSLPYSSPTPQAACRAHRVIAMKLGSYRRSRPRSTGALPRRREIARRRICRCD